MDDGDIITLLSTHMPFFFVPLGSDYTTLPPLPRRAADSIDDDTAFGHFDF